MNNNGTYKLSFGDISQHYAEFTEKKNQNGDSSPDEKENLIPIDMSRQHP